MKTWFHLNIQYILVFCMSFRYSSVCTWHYYTRQICTRWFTHILLVKFCFPSLTLPSNNNILSIFSLDMFQGFQSCFRIPSHLIHCVFFCCCLQQFCISSRQNCMISFVRTPQVNFMEWNWTMHGLYVYTNYIHHIHHMLYIHFLLFWSHLLPHSL